MEYGRPLYFRLVVCSFFLLFFLAYSQRSEIGFLPYFHTSCGLSANLECRSEMCCTRLAENTGCKKMPKICHLGTIAQLCRAISSQLRHLSTVRKNLLSSSISSMCPHNSWDPFESWEHPGKFLRVSRLGTVTARHSSSGRQTNCGVEQRTSPIFSRAAITLGIGPHSS